VDVNSRIEHRGIPMVKNVRDKFNVNGFNVVGGYAVFVLALRSNIKLKNMDEFF